MSDVFEHTDAFDPEPVSEEPAPDEAGLINRVSAAGFQVSQALEGLDQVAGLLRAAEELAKDADARRRSAEDGAALAQAQAQELGELLAMARSEAGDIERRVTDVEDRARYAEARRTEAEEQAAHAESRAEELGDLLATTRSATGDVERRVTVAEDRARYAEARRTEAEEQAAQAESRAEELEKLLATTRSATGDVERRVTVAEDRAAQAEDEAAFVASQARELGELLATARSDAEDVERRAVAAEDRATNAEDRLQQALERTFTLEAELEEANERVPAPKTPRQLTLIVDDQRDELRDSVSSEIRRPLTSIMGLTLALKHADPSTADGKHMVRQLGASARRLERLVVQLLELDGIANGSYAPTKRRADLKAIVRRVVEETPDVDGLDVRVHAEHAAIELDPALTEQMVETLLANAARRSEPGAPVWVQVSSDHTGAVIAVDDACADVPAGLTGGGSTKGKTGLALLARLAELHGGRAWVEERPGGGASFRVFLPGGSAEPASFDQDEPSETIQDDHARVVVDATSVAAPVDEPEEVDEEQAPTRPNPFDALRELSSFDDLTDELAY